MSLIEAIKELVRARELLYTWTLREFKIRYSQSFLGALWAIIQPFALMVVFSLVFSVFVRIPTDNIPYPLFVYTALMPWSFFSGSLGFAIPSLVGNMDLVGKIYFPRAIFPLSAILVCFIDFLFAGLVFILLIIFYRAPIGINVLYYIPALAIQFILTFGISLAGSALTVFFRDIRFVIPLILQIWMYISPVIYPISVIPEKYLPLYLLNPMAAIIDTYKRAVLYNQPPNWPYLGLAGLVSILILIFSYRYFIRAERQFADII